MPSGVSHRLGITNGGVSFRVTYSGLDLVYMYDSPAGERQVTQEDFTLEHRLKKLLETLAVRRVSGAAICVHVIRRESTMLRYLHMYSRSSASIHGQIGHVCARIYYQLEKSQNAAALAAAVV